MATKIQFKTSMWGKAESTVIIDKDLSVVKSICAPFSFASKQRVGEYFMSSAPWAYIENFEEYVCNYIKTLKKSKTIKTFKNKKIYKKYYGNNGQ